MNLLWHMLNGTFERTVEDIVQQERAKTRIKLTVIPKAVVEETSESPEFFHSEIQWLYEYHYTIPNEYLDKIKALPRETLLRDLNKVVYDAIARYSLFSDKDSESEKIWFLIHAFYLLRDLKATESLEVILDFLSQEDELIEFWMGQIRYKSWTVIAMCGFNNLERLKSFMKEPGRSCLSRIEIGEAIQQLYFLSLIEREVALEWFREVFSYYITNNTVENLTDTDGNSFLVRSCMAMRAKELWKEIKTLFSKDLVDSYITGNIDKIIEKLYASVNEDSKEEIKSIANDYALLIIDADGKEDADNDDSDELDWGKYYPAEPFIRTDAKVGRNDQCTCGSGKKYKKCCGK